MCSRKKNRRQGKLYILKKVGLGKFNPVQDGPFQGCSLMAAP